MRRDDWGISPPLSTVDKSPCAIFTSRGIIPLMSEVNREGLRSLLKEKGKSAREVSLQAGLGATAVKDILSGKSRDPGAATLSAIAGALETPLDGLLLGDGDPGAPTHAPRRAPPRTIALPIRFDVAAGPWKRVDEWHNEVLGWYDGAHVVDLYEGIPQWLERVQGDSYSREIPEGSLVHVVDAIELRYAPRHGDTVIVVRTREQGAWIERSIKQVVQTPFGIELWPRSYNPIYDQPIKFDPGDGSDDVEVRIVAVVLKSYRDFSK
jgi:transcriptional regulator with XRE-family HTH domain